MITNDSIYDDKVSDPNMKMKYTWGLIFSIVGTASLSVAAALSIIIYVRDEATYSLGYMIFFIVALAFSAVLVVLSLLTKRNVALNKMNQGLVPNLAIIISSLLFALTLAAGVCLPLYYNFHKNNLKMLSLNMIWNESLGGDTFRDKWNHSWHLLNFLVILCYASVISYLIVCAV